MFGTKELAEWHVAGGLGDDRYKVATWRSRAEELRTIAETMHYQEPRDLLFKMARDYDNMADRLQETMTPAQSDVRWVE